MPNLRSLSLTCPLEDRVRIYRDPIPIPLGVGDLRDRKVQVVIAGAGVAGVADIADHGAAGDELVLLDVFRPLEEVGVVVEIFLIAAQLIDSYPAALAVEEFDDLTVSGGYHGRTAGSHDVDGVVDAAFGAAGGEGIGKLTTFDPDNGYFQVEVVGAGEFCASGSVEF